MKQIDVYCEGYTEERFVTNVLAPYLQNAGITVKPHGCNGIGNYVKIKKDILLLCKRSNVTVTTMIDFYGLPNDIPGKKSTVGSCYDVVKHIERAIQEDLKRSNFFANIILHEFEGLLFSNTSKFKGVGASPGAQESEVFKLQKIRNNFPSPEHINNSYATAPSRRIKEIVPGYQKTIDGIRVAESIEIDGLAAECKHFAEWISKMVNR